MKTESTLSTYQQSAQDFLTRNNLGIQIIVTDTKLAPWDVENPAFRHHYRVKLNKPLKHCQTTKVEFDFWGSANAAAEGKHATPYDVLACISGDAFCPETFPDFCSEYGYDEDSRKALQTYKACASLATKLRRFFSESELAELAEIR